MEFLRQPVMIQPEFRPFDSLPTLLLLQFSAQESGLSFSFNFVLHCWRSRIFHLFQMLFFKGLHKAPSWLKMDGVCQCSAFNDSLFSREYWLLSRFTKSCSSFPKRHLHNENEKIASIWQFGSLWPPSQSVSRSYRDKNWRRLLALNLDTAACDESWETGIREKGIQMLSRTIGSSPLTDLPVDLYRFTHFWLLSSVSPILPWDDLSETCRSPQ